MLKSSIGKITAIIMFISMSSIIHANEKRSSCAEYMQYNSKDNMMKIYTDYDTCILLDKHLIQSRALEIQCSPKFAEKTTKLSLQFFDGILLNGMRLDILVPGCYGVGNEHYGCFNKQIPWKIDVMSPINSFGYPRKNLTGLSNASGLIGFAADGFAIRGMKIAVDGKIKEVTSSYRLKKGKRKPIQEINPGGNYNGKYRDDYEYVSGLGDLDECNGKSVNGVYSYYITKEFPYCMACFKGKPNISFIKSPKPMLKNRF